MCNFLVQKLRKVTQAQASAQGWADGGSRRVYPHRRERQHIITARLVETAHRGGRILVAEGGRRVRHAIKLHVDRRAVPASRRRLLRHLTDCRRFLARAARTSRARAPGSARAAAQRAPPIGLSPDGPLIQRLIHAVLRRRII